MKEHVYTIPVNDAFRADCECPVCALYQELEQNAVDYTLGPSYMEDDTRAETDRLGFCMQHIQLLYRQKNRLGLALMLKTHTDKTIQDLKKLSGESPAAGGRFRRQPVSKTASYIKTLEESCFICQRIDAHFPHYIHTIFYLWKKDPAFREAFAACQGFCTLHYGLLGQSGEKQLDKQEYAAFLECLNRVYLAGMERVNEDLEWFIQKYDYRNADKPWKNAKDAIPRGILKTNHVAVEDA